MSTSNLSETQISALKDKLGRISAMRRLWLVTFRCMSEQATLPDGKLELAGASAEKINEYIATIHKVTVFPRERLSPLRKICYEVYRELKDKGLLVGNSGAYIIPNKYTQEVREFLDQKAREYRREIAKISADYKSIYDEQVLLATRDINDVTLRNVIIDLIPTKDEFVKRTYCSFAPYALALADSWESSDLEKIAQDVEEIHAEENRRFLDKIHEIFAAYLPRLDAELAVNRTARMSLLNAVCKRADEAFSRLDLALRGTAAYADLQAMFRFYKDGIIDAIVTYTESIAKGPVVPDFLTGILRMRVAALSSHEKFRDFCKLQNAAQPQCGNLPAGDETEAVSIAASDFDGADTDADPEYREESFDITQAIRSISDLQLSQDAAETAVSAADPGSDPKIAAGTLSAGEQIAAETPTVTVTADCPPPVGSPVPYQKHDAACPDDGNAIAAAAQPKVRSSFAARFSLR